MAVWVLFLLALAGGGLWLALSSSRLIDPLARLEGGALLLIAVLGLGRLVWDRLSPARDRLSRWQTARREATERPVAVTVTLHVEATALDKLLQHIEQQHRLEREHQVALGVSAARDLATAVSALTGSRRPSGVEPDEADEARPVAAMSKGDDDRPRAEASPGQDIDAHHDRATPEALLLEARRVLELLALGPLPARTWNALNRAMVPNRVHGEWQLPYWVREPEDVLCFVEQVASGQEGVRGVAEHGQAELRRVLDQLRAAGRLDGAGEQGAEQRRQTETS